MSEFNFSERQNLIYALNFTKSCIKLDPDMEKSLPEPVMLKTLERLLDELGGNIELNKQRYEAAQK